MFTGLSEGCSKEKKEQNTIEEYTKIAGKAPGNFSYNINWQNSLGVYSISENLAVSFNGDILSDVTMPKGLSDVIRTYVKRSSLGVESDIALPLVYHFSELQKKGALNDESKERKEVYALRALYTLNEA